MNKKPFHRSKYIVLKIKFFKKYKNEANFEFIDVKQFLQYIILKN